MASLVSVIATFLQFQNELRMYHWSTLSYARHVASGNLYSSLDGHIDKFVETFVGAFGRGTLAFPSKSSMVLRAHSDASFVKSLNAFASFLDGELVPLIKSKPDLINLKDEMVNEVHQTLYLATLQ